MGADSFEGGVGAATVGSPESGRRGPSLDQIGWLVALPGHGSALLALVALVGVPWDPAAFRRQ